jgi:hypothetical protein
MGNAPKIVSYKIKRKTENPRDYCVGFFESVTFTLSDGSTFTEKNFGMGYGGRYYFGLDNERFESYFHDRLKGAACGYQAHFDRNAFYDGDQYGEWVVTRYASEKDWASVLFDSPETALKFESEDYIKEKMKDIELSKIALSSKKINMKDRL